MAYSSIFFSAQNCRIKTFGEMTDKQKTRKLNFTKKKIDTSAIRHQIINICHMLVIFRCLFLKFGLVTNLIRMEIDKVVDNMVAQMLVNDPIHELEACKGDGEKDTAVLVNVRGCHAEHLVQVLHIALRIGGWGCRGWWKRWGAWRAGRYGWQGW